MGRIAYTKPSITDLEVSYATDAAKNGWGEKCYHYIERFEKKFAEHIGTQFGIATSSCTGAMTLGLHALGIKENDEIILADTNWIATASPILHIGAIPVFVDIRKDTWCLDYEKIEAAITENTKAIIATHLYGNLCEMDTILDIGMRFKIPVIEDAAEAIGSIYKTKRAGSMGTFSTFSFHGTKTMVTGEGGMFLTNDENLYEKVCTLNNHGRNKFQERQFWADVPGHKFKMSNIQAAIGCAQVERIEDLILRKREIFNRYKQAFSQYSEIQINCEMAETFIGAWMPNIVFDPKTNVTRELLLSTFKQNNVDARVFFWPLSSLPMFENNPNSSNSYDIASRSINLPSYHDLSHEEQQTVIDLIINLMKR